MTPFEIDPNVVKPGWTALLVVIGLACVMVLLYLSMRRQFKKLNASAGAGGDVAGSAGAVASERTTTDGAPGADAQHTRSGPGRT